MNIFRFFKQKVLSQPRASAIKVLEKVLYLLIITVIFRFLWIIPLPSIPVDSLKSILDQYSFGEILNMTSSGALASTTLIAVGLNPYINASIMLQLLGSVIPKLQDLQKEGIRGRMVINMYTRLLTVPLAILQSIVIYLALKQYQYAIPQLQGIFPLSLIELGTLVATLTGGAILLMWVSELITEDGFLNGSSYLIAAGILADIPGVLSGSLETTANRIVAITVAVSLLWVGFIVFITSAERRIAIKHARIRTFGQKPIKDNHLPLKLNQSGVMPVIFALSFLSTPMMILDAIMKSDLPDKYTWLSKLDSFFQMVANSNSETYNPWYYNGILVFLIVSFSIFYTFVVFKPSDTAENLQKQGAYIVGVRPGEETKRYLTKIMLRLAVVGSIFLALIAIVPMVIPDVLQSTGSYSLPAFLGGATISKNWSVDVPILFSGTGILIVIGVAVDMLEKIRSMKTEEYSIKGI